MYHWRKQMLNEQDVMPRLTRVFRNVFGDKRLIISRRTTADDVDDWDSLEHINLIAAVENEFAMKFKMKEVSSMKNVGEMVAIIRERTPL